MQIVTKWRQRQTGKIRRRGVQFHQRIVQMLEHAVPDAAPQLMVRRRSLNQALHKIAPRLRMASPDFFPRLVRFPIFSGVEKRHALSEIGAIFFTQPRRELLPVDVWGRRQAVRVP